MTHLRMDDLSGPSRQSGDAICYRDCPICGSRRWKLYVTPSKGLWYCHAGEHGGGGTLDVGSVMHGRGRKILRMREAEPRLEWRPMNLPAWEPLSKRAVRYLHKRGLTDYQIRTLGLVEMQERMRVILPYRGREGSIIYWNARAYSTLEEGPKYLAASGKHPLYVLPSWHAPQPTFLVEGCFDAIALSQHVDGCVVAMGGKGLPRYLVPDIVDLCQDGTVYAVLDGDAVAGALQLRRKLAGVLDVRIVVLPKDEDPSSLGERVRVYLEESGVPTRNHVTPPDEG